MNYGEAKGLVGFEIAIEVNEYHPMLEGSRAVPVCVFGVVTRVDDKSLIVDWHGATYRAPYEDVLSVRSRMGHDFFAIWPTNS